MGLACRGGNDTFEDRVGETRAMAHRAIDEWIDGLAQLGSAENVPLGTLLPVTV